MSLFFILWMTWCKFGGSCNKHPNHSCAKCGSDIGSQKIVIGKWLHSETPSRIMDRCHATIFKQRKSYRLTMYKIGLIFFVLFCFGIKKEELKIMLIFAWNLHQKRLNALYSVWYHKTEAVLLFKMVYRLTWKPLLLRVPVQFSLHRDS